MSTLLAACLAMGLAAPDVRVPEVRAAELEIQKVGNTTHFRVQLNLPSDRLLPLHLGNEVFDEKGIRQRGQLPRLIPLDDQTRAVFLEEKRKTAGVTSGTLTFSGLRVGKAPTARFRLLYPVKPPLRQGFAAALPDAGLEQVELTLHWKNAEKGEDLQPRWQRARVYSLDNLAAQMTGSSYLEVQQKLARNKYLLDVPEAGLHNRPLSSSLLQAFGGVANDSFFELTTGATSLTETLAENRLLNTREKAREPRTIPIARIEGITMAAHPWEKMIGDRKPAEERLASLVPEDNYYLTVHDPFAFVSAWEVLDTWGGNVLRSPKMHDRDHGLRDRYEGQLCLPSREMLRPAITKLVRDIALTGSDLFWTEGSDITVLIEVSDTEAFRKEHDTFITRARARLGAALREGSETHGGYTIERFTTERREISLYRVSVGSVVVCSNSPAAVRAILDVAGGHRASLMKGGDFKYMRTVFRREAKTEDGFAFLSDAFVRRMVGPATRIKQARRQQARAALTLASQAALLVGQETGTLPATTRKLLKGAGLQDHMLADPEGAPVTWDAERVQAFSRTYNTLEFSTPLLDLPLDRVSESEAEAYKQFRIDYQRQWRQFIDPVGIRFKLAPGPMQIEMYLLPLVENSAYNQLRWMAGSGTIKYSPSRIPPSTVARFLSKIPKDTNNLGLGEWVLFHLDNEGLDLRKFTEMSIRQDLGETRTWLELELQLYPVLLGAQVKNAATLKKVMNDLWSAHLKPEGKSQSTRQRAGHEIVTSPIRETLFTSHLKAIHSSFIHDGFYLTFNPKLMDQWIDTLVAHAKTPAKDLAEVNTSLYLAPPSDKNARAISALLEWETHKRALGACAAWQGLFDAGVVTPDMPVAQRNLIARRVLGHVPQSPDGAPFIYDEKLGQVRNQRHGSLSLPTFQEDLAFESQVLSLFHQLRSVRADLRFREDGIHTTVTIDWRTVRK